MSSLEIAQAAVLRPIALSACAQHPAKRFDVQQTWVRFGRAGFDAIRVGSVP